MVKIKKDIANFIEKNPGLIATSAPSGTPNVVPKGSLKVLDEENLVYADLFGGKTTENIKNNPTVAISVVDFEGMKGYQLKGKASLIDSGAVYEKIVKTIEKLPMDLPKPRYAVKIQVKEIYDLTPGPNAGKKIQ